MDKVNITGAKSCSQFWHGNFKWIKLAPNKYYPTVKLMGLTGQKQPQDEQRLRAAWQLSKVKKVREVYALVPLAQKRR